VHGRNPAAGSEVKRTGDQLRAKKIRHSLRRCQARVLRRERKDKSQRGGPHGNRNGTYRKIV